MISKAKPITKQQVVYQRLRSQIMSGSLTPGSRLVIDRLAENIGVSAIPVREALTLLEKEGLVEIRPHAGAVVSDIPESAVEEIFAMLEVLETVSCRLGISRLSASDLKELKSLAKRMRDTDDMEQWLKLNRRFHESLPRLAGLSRLEEQTRRVGEDWERLRRLRFADRKGENKIRADRQHEEFIRALEERDADRAIECVVRHNRDARAAYLHT